MKVAIYTICGAGEASHIGRFIASCKGADAVFFLATSGDPDVARELVNGMLNVHFARIAPFRFDDARNAALAMVPDDYDVCIALDMDETLEPGWRDALENAWTAQSIAGRAEAYWIDFDFTGQVFRQNNRVHSRHGWRWKHPCHEALVPSMQRATHAIETEGLRITHRPDLSKQRPNYLEMLAWGQWEEPSNLRMLHYYGRELMFNGYYKDAAERFESYLYLDRLNCAFPAERTLTEQYLAECKAKIRTVP